MFEKEKKNSDKREEKKNESNSTAKSNWHNVNRIIIGVRKIIPNSCLLIDFLEKIIANNGKHKKKIFS